MIQKESTEDLMKQLLEGGDIEAYIENKRDLLQPPSISDYLVVLLKQKDISRARAIEMAGIDRVYGYEIFRGKKAPGRDMLLRILVALNTGINNVQNVLKNTGYPILYARNIRDAVIIYGIQRSFDVGELNELLYDLGQKTI